jgi:acetyl esterase/lipase
MSRIVYDVSYAFQSPRQKLDIYLPDQSFQPFPVILWLHPGGFSAGDKSVMVDLLAPPLLAKGYALVCANYRLIDEAILPAQIFDAKAAVRWIKVNAAAYKFNPEKIVAWGCSAGATLAVLLGTTAHVRELEDLSMGNPEVSSSVNAVVDWYGPIDWLQLDTQLVRLGYSPVHYNNNSGLFKLMGSSKTGFPDKCKIFNPVNYITDKAPPFYIQHGDYRTCRSF